MIYLLITVAGVIFLFLGLWAMSFGFSTPPNIFLFLAGLFSFVIGLMLIILFAGKIDLGSMKKSAPVAKESPEKASRVTKRAEIAKSTISDKKKIEPKKQVKPKKIMPKRVKKDKSDKSNEAKSNAEVEKQPDKTKKSSRKPRKFLKSSKKDKDDSKKSKESNKKELSEKTESKTGKSFPFRRSTTKPLKTSDNASKMDLAKDNTNEPKNKSEYPKPINPAKSKTVKAVKSQPVEPVKPVKPVKSQPVKPVKQVKSKPVKAVKSVKPVKPVETPKMVDKSDSHYVKERLNKLKQDYIENVDDVEDLIEERLDSFRGAINQIRSESKEPSIIWSFDASDVQEAMKDTILAANSKVIMMYPWIRNIDVGILKKFMDTKSRMIIQEAGLDDDASVELIKVLLDNNVQIRTMPHIHTVAVVSDDKHGLIISTDPIYESFEVGVIYKDEKSIMEIEKLFEEAWNLSQDISMEN